MRRALPVALAVIALAGCATPAVDRATAQAFADGAALVGERPQLNATDEQRRAALEQVDALLAGPLAADDALRIALIHSPGAQQLFAAARVQQAAAIQSGRISNPVFTFERLVRGDDKDIGRLLSFGLFDLLSWPWRASIAEAQSEQARLTLVAAVVDVAVRTREAWVEAVAAQQALAYYEDVRTAAEASAELARRMQSVGNFSPLQRAREQAFYADAVMQQARAQHAWVAAREKLVRRLGLDDERARRLQLPPRLPDLPPAPRSEQSVAQAAFDARLDLRAARAELEGSARRRGFASAAGWLGGTHLGLARNSETGEPRQRGFELEIPLPLFDAGDAQRAGADAGLLAALHRTRQVTIDAQSQLREAYHAYRSRHDIARHYRDQVVPLRNHIAEENLYRYNGMLIGVFELLADARAQIHAVIGAIEAQRDFWLADAALQAALIGRPVAITDAPAAAAMPADAGGH